MEDSPQWVAVKIASAKKGCGQCNGPVRFSSKPAGDPFTGGPWKGRYLCDDCWTLYYNQHPEHLADLETRQFVEEEADRVRRKRLCHGAEILYEDGENRVLLTHKGTLFFDLHSSIEQPENEFDPEKFEALLKALHGLKDVKEKIPGFETVLA